MISNMPLYIINVIMKQPLKFRSGISIQWSWCFLGFLIKLPMTSISSSSWMDKWCCACCWDCSTTNGLNSCYCCINGLKRCLYCINGLHFCYNLFNGMHFCNNFFNGLHSLNFCMNFFHGLINCLNSFMNNCFRFHLMNNLLDWLNCLKCDWLNCHNLGDFDLRNWNFDWLFIFDCLN